MAATAATAAAFPDDMVREILVRLDDPAGLFRCAVTCKRWRGLVAKPSFLRRRRWPDHTSSTFLSGFFMCEEEAILKKDSTFVTTFIPTSGSVFGSKSRSLMSFFSGAPRAARSLLRHAVPLASRHGLLLVRLESPDSSDGIVHLAVCNLLARTCHKLPPLECNWKFDKSGYAILTSVDCSSNAKQKPSVPQGYSDFFKVLIIGNDAYHQPHNLHSFTSGETRWTGPIKFSFAAEGKSGCMPLNNARAVVWHGTAHWLVRYFTIHYPMHDSGPFIFSKETRHNSSWRIISVNAETCGVSLAKIETPIGHDIIHSYAEAQLTVGGDGKLSLFHMRKGGYKLEIWTRQEDDGPSRWLCAPDVDLKPPNRMSLLILGEKGGILLVKNNHGNVYTVDLDTGEMEEVTSFKNISRRQIVPLEMDWPTLFVSRLGE